MTATAVSLKPRSLASGSAGGLSGFDSSGSRIGPVRTIGSFPLTPLSPREREGVRGKSGFEWSGVSKMARVVLLQL
jgi:hypothetical protein